MNQLEKETQNEFSNKFCGTGRIVDFESYQEIEKWIVKHLSKAYKAGLEKGRKEVINEWKEDKKKLLQGFRYKEEK